MKFLSNKILRSHKWVEVVILYQGKRIAFTVQTIDGKVQGSMEENFYTNRLSYFKNTSTKLKEKHFNLVKEYIEENVNL